MATPDGSVKDSDRSKRRLLVGVNAMAAVILGRLGAYGGADAAGWILGDAAR
jgi:hypothetical protein